MHRKLILDVFWIKINFSLLLRPLSTRPVVFWSMLGAYWLNFAIYSFAIFVSFTCKTSYLNWFLCATLSYGYTEVVYFTNSSCKAIILLSKACNLKQHEISLQENLWFWHTRLFLKIKVCLCEIESVNISAYCSYNAIGEMTEIGFQFIWILSVLVICTP